MQSTNSVNDQWIVRQLLGIRMLEQELASALGNPSVLQAEQLQRRVRQLNAWVDAVDHSLVAEKHRQRTA